MQQNTIESEALTGDERLAILAEFLEKFEETAKQRFDMGVWFEDNDLFDLCGAAACALGWAATIPVLRREGLQLSGCFSQLPTFRIGDAWHYGTSAAERFFELPSRGVADLLFMPAAGYSSPAEVAKLLRQYLATPPPWRLVFKAAELDRRKETEHAGIV